MSFRKKLKVCNSLTLDIMFIFSFPSVRNKDEDAGGHLATGFSEAGGQTEKPVANFFS